MTARVGHRAAPLPNRLQEVSIKASLQIDNPVLSDALVFFGVFPLLPYRAYLPDPLIVGALLLMLAGVALPRFRHRVSVSNRGSSLRVRSWCRRLTLDASNLFEVRQASGVVSILLSDGRLLQFSGSRASDLWALVDGVWQGPSPKLVFRLWGIPAGGRWGLLSRILPLSVWLRPKLSVAEECVSIRSLFWVRHIPLARIVRLRVLGHGIELGLADSSSVELCTFAGLSFRWHERLYDYNELLCGFLQAARARALNRFLTGYRGAGTRLDARSSSRG